MNSGVLQCFFYFFHTWGKSVFNNFRTTTTVKKFPFHYCVWQKRRFWYREIASDILVDKMHGHDFTLQALNHHYTNVKDQKGIMIPCHAMSDVNIMLINTHNALWKSNYFNHGTLSPHYIMFDFGHRVCVILMFLLL